MAQILVYADEELKKTVGEVAELQERSISQVVRKWIKEGLERWEEAKQSPKTAKVELQASDTKQVN